MSRPSKETYDLSDAEKRDLIALIQQGKTRDVCTTILPFQTLEHIDEPSTETRGPGSQEDLFDPRGRQLRGWTNRLIWGDNKLILSSLKSGALRAQIEAAGGLKLIYIDPPFDVGADSSMDIEIGGETFHKEPNLLEQIACRDTWGRGADSFIAMIYERLTDFSVHYTQGAGEAAEAGLKAGKSAVVCEQGHLYKLSKGKDGVVTRERLTKAWTDWVDYWAVDFDYMSRKEMIQVQVDAGVDGAVAGDAPSPLPSAAGRGGNTGFESRWTGGFIFENEWQSFRTRQNRALELTTAEHSYDKPGRYTVAVKVIDIFGNDTMTLVPVNVG
jgi:hypothetical protein